MVFGGWKKSMNILSQDKISTATKWQDLLMTTYRFLAKKNRKQVVKNAFDKDWWPCSCFYDIVDYFILITKKPNRFILLKKEKKKNAIRVIEKQIVFWYAITINKDIYLSMSNNYNIHWKLHKFKQSHHHQFCILIQILWQDLRWLLSPFQTKMNRSGFEVNH